MSLRKVLRRASNAIPQTNQVSGVSSLAYAQRLFKPGTPLIAQMESYGQNGLVFSIVSKLANGCAQTDWKLYQKSDSGLKEDRVEVTRHLALDIWNKPNEFHTRQEFVEGTQQHVDLTGEGWWVVERYPGTKIISQMWEVRPDRMAIGEDKEKFISGYVYTAPDGEKIPLERDQVIMIRMPNPMDPYRGLGPIQSILIDIKGSHAASQYNYNFFINGAEPGGVIEVPETLGDDEYNLLKFRWNDSHKGVNNAHRVAILEHGKYVATGSTQKDMQFSELQTLSDQRIMQAFAFPKTLLGQAEDVNRASAESAEYVFSKWSLVPRLERIKQALNNDFLPMFYPDGSTPDVEFDYCNPVADDAVAAQANRSSRVTDALAMIAAGFDEIAVLEAFDLPDLPLKKVPDGLANQAFQGE